MYAKLPIFILTQYGKIVYSLVPNVWTYFYASFPQVTMFETVENTKLMQLILKHNDSSVAPGPRFSKDPSFKTRLETSIYQDLEGTSQTTRCGKLPWEISVLVFDLSSNF